MSSSSHAASSYAVFYEYELPTTGAIALSDICTDMSAEKVYGRHIAEAAQSRATVRGVLKDVRRSGGGSGGSAGGGSKNASGGGGGSGGKGDAGGGEKDYLRVVKVR